MVPRALKVAEELAEEGISMEVIDPRTVVPLDKGTIIESVKKTGKLVTFDEGCKNGNLGSEIAAIIAEEAIGYLLAPILRVGAPMTPIPYCPPLEKLYIPDEGQVKEAVRKVLQYS
jgi:pyruvate dehydrogenase E1 component beta subunit